MSKKNTFKKKVDLKKLAILGLAGFVTSQAPIAADTLNNVVPGNYLAAAGCGGGGDRPRSYSYTADNTDDTGYGKRNTS